MNLYHHLKNGKESTNIKNLENSLKGSTSEINLVPVSEIPIKYQPVFRSFPYFNIVQSTVFEDAFYTDKSLVVCAPTGSGKTVIFELCIIRLLMLISELNHNPSKFKIVYMAPVKSLCNERFQDWKSKFEPLGILCIQLTGDSESEDYFELQKYSLILTTPEKWDSVSRLWKNNKVLVQMVKLLLIDEIHLLNEEERGATIEATLSRMKTIQFVLSCNSSLGISEEPNFRFIAVSATFPNVEDVANWLSTPKLKGIFYKLDESLRPVCLRKVVIGYPCDSKVSEFKFDLMLSYKLNHVIQTYSENKPTLVFCSTRKSVLQTACILSKSMNFVINASHKMLLLDAANRMHESALRECTLKGIGFHHGGLDVSDRRLIENMFLSCQLLVLISTSTLSMGVNFPAHLVVIKSTSQYVAGCYKEYSDTQMLQMIGRAGRPQFDRNATAVIMTKFSLKAKYESLVNGTQLIESNLHKHMAEHLNAEIVLGSITDISIAMEWLKATYLYQRVFKNPEYYGMSPDLSNDRIERKLQDICIKELNGLRKYQLIYMDNDSFYLQPTKTGRLMAKYYIALETMKQFYSITGNENLAEMIALFSSCKEFEDIHLRVNEKKCLNELNKSKMSSIRFPLQGKVKSRQMKINWYSETDNLFPFLIQATFGCLIISEPSLNQDIARIFRNAVRISRCLVEYLSVDEKGFAALHNAVILSKCFKARLWENSKHVSRQLDKIGITFSTLLVNAGIATFDDILSTNPREIELVLKRNPPFGTSVIDSALKIPKYYLQVEQSSPISNRTAIICIIVSLENIDNVRRGSNENNSGCYILIGDENNKIILFEKTRNTQFFQEQNWTKKIVINRIEKGDEINIYVISDTYVGVDIKKTYSILYNNLSMSENSKDEIETSVRRQHALNNINQASEKLVRNCNHKCINKDVCSHSCCKTGVTVIQKKSQMSNFMTEMKNKMNDWPSNKVKIGVGTFLQNIKMFEKNHCNSNAAMNFNSTFPENCKNRSPSPEQISFSDSDFNYFIPEYEERQEEEYNTMKFDEECGLENISFDVNFGSNFAEKSIDEHGNSQQNIAPCGTIQHFQIYPQKINNRPKHMHKIEKWDDSTAAEETFNMCLNFLSNYY